jgi:hypothetical protein
MTTRTIPEYLEDERRNRADTQLRTEEEAARIQPLHHGHHRTPKPPKPELAVPVDVVAKARKTTVAKTRKTTVAKTRKPASEARKTPRAARKTGTKARKVA